VEGGSAEAAKGDFAATLHQHRAVADEGVVEEGEVEHNFNLLIFD
jgi:hypothetical protein